MAHGESWSPDLLSLWRGFQATGDYKARNLLKVVLGYQEVPANVHVIWGRQKEVAIRHSYTLHIKGHLGLTVRKSGLIVDEGHPFLATSLDSLVTCPHCAPTQGLLEIKCPSVHRGKTPKEGAA